MVPGCSGIGSDLAAEKLPPRAIALRRLVGGGDVDQLVVHEPVHPFVGGDDLVDEAERRDLQHQEIAGNRSRRCVAAIGKVDQDDGDRLRRLPAPQLLLKLEGVEKGPGDVGGEVALCRIEVEEAEVLDPHLVKLGGARYRAEKEPCEG